MKTKWGIIGLGGIAERFARSLKLTENAELYAVASRDINKATPFSEKFSEKFAEKFATNATDATDGNVIKPYGSYSELIQDKNVDVIYVATPMSEHFKNVKECLLNGKNVLCEKAFTCTYEEAKELTELAKSRKVFLMEAMWVKFMPVFKKAKKWFESGKIGEIRTIDASFCRPTPYDPDSRLYRKDLGGGATLDLGVYPISLITAFLGYDCEIESYLDLDKFGVDRNMTAVLKYKNAENNNGRKTYATARAGFDIESDCSATIVGTKGKIILKQDFYHAKKTLLYDENGNILEDINTEIPLDMDFIFQIHEVQNCLENSKLQSDINSLDDTLQNMKIIQCIMDNVE
ncbi:MAG: Gfo/Idh/MocA family oxidoreductase [Oscillospiraceae bacterium]|jgi:predicted dehydrogenase|nr:Gfo/Idh/MocA family oxidoreductase [Oscillospiraceae bacterium]